MSRKISFTDSLYRYFAPTFHTELRKFVEGAGFKKLKGFDEDTTVEFDSLSYWNTTILETRETTVIFYMSFNFSYHVQKATRDSLESICSWNIAQREKGLTMGEFRPAGDVPVPECTYTDDIVPFVTKNDYADMADLFKKKVFGEDLPDTEGYLFALDVVSKLGLQQKQCRLQDTCTGTIIMVDKVLTFRNPDGYTYDEEIKAGTILCDFNKAALMSQSLLATTLIHESFHWVFHRCAFELGLLYSKTDKGFVCLSNRKAEGSTAAEGNKYIEIQTNAVVPLILVSREQICADAIEYEKEYRNSGMTKPEILSHILNDIRNCRGLSVESIRRCLVEGGFTGFRGISIFQDKTYLRSFCFAPDALEENETFCIPRKEMDRLFKEDSIIREKVLDGEYVYVDGHLVLNDPAYVSYKTLITPELTQEALLHAEKCFMKFQMCRRDVKSEVKFDYRLDRVPKEMEKTFNAIYDSSLSSEERTQARMKWVEHIRKWRKCSRDSFGETFKEIMKFRKKSATFFDGKGLDKDEVYRLYKKENGRPQLRTLATIGGCLNMPYEVFIWFLEKAGYSYYTTEPEMLKILELMDDRSLFKDISEFDEDLIRSGFKPLSKPTKAR